MNQYPFSYIMAAPGDESTPGAICIHKFRFKTIKNRVYFVNIPQFEKHTYSVKFYARNHRLSDDRYRLMLDDYDARNVIFTVLKISLRILEMDKVASFAFVGMPGLDEKHTNTKRFRVYTLFTSFFISSKDFIHAKDENNSIYVLLNKKNQRTRIQDLPEIAQYFMEHYRFSCPLNCVQHSE